MIWAATAAVGEPILRWLKPWSTKYAHSAASRLRTAIPWQPPPARTRSSSRRSTWGRIDILINNAGVVRGGNLATLTDDDYEFDMAIASGGTMRVTRAIWPRLLEQDYGRIVNVSSGSVFGMGAGISYPATKAAVIGITRGLAVAALMSGKNIKCNVIMPIAYSRLSRFSRRQ